MSPEQSSPVQTLLDLLARAWRIRAVKMALVGAGWLSLVSSVGLLVALVIDGTGPFSAGRTVASCVFYGVTVAAFVVFVLRPLFQRGEPAQEARRIERRFPDIRHRILPALEISGQTPPTQSRMASRTVVAGTSPEFVQETVLSAVRICQSLPWDRYIPEERVAASKRLMLIIAIVFGIVLIQPFGSMPVRVGRIAFPWANLGRVSSVRIEVLRPDVFDEVYARGTPVTVLASFSNNWSRQAILEVRSEAGPVQRLEMTPEGPNAEQQKRARSVFIASAPRQKFRVVADGAETPWYDCETRPRPRANDLRAMVLPPDYCGIDAYQVPLSNTLADLVVIQGSRISFSFTSDTELDSATLILNPNLGATPEQQATPADKSEDYRFIPTERRYESPAIEVKQRLGVNVALLGKESRLQGPLPQSIAVIPLTDKPPTIGWESPKEMQTLVNRDESFAMQWSVRDEMPLREAWIEIRVGSGDIERRSGVVETAVIESAPTAWQWRAKSSVELELQELSLDAGDRIEVRLGSRDRGGNEAYSEKRTLMVRATDTAVPDRQQQQGRLRIMAMIDELSEKAKSLAASADQPLPLIADTAKSLQADIRLIVDEVFRSIAQHDTSVNRLELQLVGEAVADLQSSFDLGFTADSATQLQASGSIDASALRARLASASQQASGLAVAFRGLMTGYGLRTIAETALPVHEAQSRLRDKFNGAGSPKNATSPIAGLVRTQSVIITQLEAFQEDADELTLAMAPSASQRMQGVLTALDTAISMAGRESRNNNLNALQHNASMLTPILKKLSRPHDIVPQWQQLYQASTRLILQLDSVGPAGKIQASPDSRMATQSLAESLATRRTIVRSSNLAIGQYSSDLGLAARSVANNTENLASHGPRVQALLNILKSQYELQLAEMLIARTGNGPRDSVATDRCLALGCVQAAAEQIHSEHWIAPVSPQVSEEAMVALNSAVRDLHATLEQTMPLLLKSDRLSDLRGTNLQISIDQLRNKISALANEVQAVAAIARRELDELAPSLAGQAELAAYESKQLSLASNDLSTEYSRDVVTQAEEQILGLASREQQIQNRLALLHDGLVDLAERQDLLSGEEIERAQLADAIRRQVDAAAAILAKSLDGISAKNDPRETGPGLAYAASVQGDASLQLADLIEALKRLESSSTDASQAVESQNPQSDESRSDAASAQPPNDKGAENGTQTGAEHSPPEQQAEDQAEAAAYERAESLSALANLTPEELVDLLQKELERSIPMQDELSAIARASLERAIESLNQNSEELAAAEADFIRSDPRIVAHRRKVEFEHDFDEEFSQVLIAVQEQASQAAELGRQSSLSREIANGANVADRKMPADALANIDKYQAQATEASGRSLGLSAGDQAALMRDARDRARRAQQSLIKAARRLITLRQQQERKLNNLLASKAKVGPEDHSAELAELQQSRSSLQEALPQISRNILISDDTLNPGAALSAELLGILKQQWELYQSTSRAVGKSPRPKVALDRIQATDLPTRLQPRRQSAVEQLERAGRHEARLAHVQMATLLASLSRQIDVGGDSFDTALSRQLAGPVSGTISGTSVAAKRDDASSSDRAARSEAESSVLSEEVSSRILSTIDSRKYELKSLVVRIESLLGRHGSAAENNQNNSNENTLARTKNDSSSANEKLALAMEPAELAKLLDEMDQAMHPSESFGESEDDSSGTRSSSSNSSGSSQTLRQQARQLAQSLSSNRRPPPGKSKGDLGTATESQTSDTNPQAGTAYQIVDVARLKGSWGELEQQSLDEATESNRHAVAPEFREQVEAYFDRLNRQE